MAEEKAVESQLMRQIVNIFSSVKGYEIIKWNVNPDSVGITFMKDYPVTSPFVPAKNQKGKNVNVVMVRIGYMLKNTSQSLNVVPLIVDVGKHDLYRFENFLNNLKDENSPTSESLAASKASRKPESLDIPSKFELDLKKSTIYDVKKNKAVEAQDLVDFAYNLHLRTLTDKRFRAKLFLRDKVANIIDPINIFLKKIIYYLFGKRIEVPKERKFLTGTISPYEYSDLHDLPEKATILGWELPISLRTAYTFVVFSCGVYLCHYFWHQDLFYFFKIMNSTNNTFFLATLTGGGLLFFDKLVPYFLLFVINSLIRLYWLLLKWQIKI